MAAMQRLVQTADDARRFRAITRTHIAEAKQDPRIQERMARHRSPHGYANWEDHVALCHTLAVHIAAKNLGAETPETYGDALSLLFFASIATAEAPPRFLDQQLAESLHHTDLAALEEAPPMALPAFRLFLPKGLARIDTGTGLDVALVLDRRTMASALHEGDSKGPGLAILFPIATGETYFIDFLWSDPSSSRLCAGDPWSKPLTKAARLCAHAVLVMAYMPELISADPSPRISGGRGFGKATDLPPPAAPVWIGRDFQRRVQTPPNRRPRQKLPGRPRRAHWRQGHWRSVACGPRRQKRRLCWIQPVFVKSAVATTAAA